MNPQKPVDLFHCNLDTRNNQKQFQHCQEKEKRKEKKV